VTDPAQPFLEALKALNQALAEIDAPSMLIGGIAVITLGIPRYTADIDVTIQGRDSDPGLIFQAFARNGIIPRIEGAMELAKTRQILLAVHQPSGIPIDASLAWLPFEEEAIRSGQIRNYAGVEITIPRPEDLLVYKLVACRPRDLDDAEKLLLLYGKEIDLERVRDLLEQFSAVLEDRSRLEALERLIRKTAISGKQ
jgi:hypothetical protein